LARWPVSKTISSRPTVAETVALLGATMLMMPPSPSRETEAEV
jgi:hypothetical protein